MSTGIFRYLGRFVNYDIKRVFMPIFEKIKEESRLFLQVGHSVYFCFPYALTSQNGAVLNNGNRLLLFCKKICHNTLLTNDIISNIIINA